MDEKGPVRGAAVRGVSDLRRIYGSLKFDFAIELTVDHIVRSAVLRLHIKLDIRHFRMWLHLFELGSRSVHKGTDIRFYILILYENRRRLFLCSGFGSSAFFLNG